MIQAHGHDGDCLTLAERLEVQGWVAGLVLVLKHHSDPPSSHHAPDLGLREVFEYFEAEVPGWAVSAGTLCARQDRLSADHDPGDGHGAHGGRPRRAGDRATGRARLLQLSARGARSGVPISPPVSARVGRISAASSAACRYTRASPVAKSSPPEPALSPGYIARLT